MIAAANCSYHFWVNNHREKAFLRRCAQQVLLQTSSWLEANRASHKTWLISTCSCRCWASSCEKALTVVRHAMCMAFTMCTLSVSKLGPWSVHGCVGFRTPSVVTRAVAMWAAACRHLWSGRTDLAASVTLFVSVACREDFEFDKVPDQWFEHPTEAMRNPSEKEWYTTAYWAGQVRI